MQRGTDPVSTLGRQDCVSKTAAGKAEVQAGESLESEDVGGRGPAPSSFHLQGTSYCKSTQNPLLQQNRPRACTYGGGSMTRRK